VLGSAVRRHWGIEINRARPPQTKKHRCKKASRQSSRRLPRQVLSSGNPVSPVI
jgi:hypothetical protein